MNPTSCSFGSRFVWAQTTIFSTVVLWLLSRIFEEFQNPAIQTKIVQTLGGFFTTNKSASANGKKYTNRDPETQEVGFICVWCGSELWSLFKYSKLKIKNQKPTVPLYRLISFSRPIQWYHSPTDPILPDGIFECSTNSYLKRDDENVDESGENAAQCLACHHPTWPVNNPGCHTVQSLIF